MYVGPLSQQMTEINTFMREKGSFCLMDLEFSVHSHLTQLFRSMLTQVTAVVVHGGESASLRVVQKQRER